jgi:hypothetical protein
LLLKLPVKEQLQEAHTRTTLGRGIASPSTSIPSSQSRRLPRLFQKIPRNKIIGSFAMAVRQGRFSTNAYDTLALGTVWKYHPDISATGENGQQNPTKDNDLQLSFILLRQFRAFKNADQSCN